MRDLVVELWSGPRLVRRMGLTTAQQDEAADHLDDETITASLRKLGVEPIPATVEARRERLRSWPSQADLDAIATAWTAANDGVRPVIRILDRATIGRHSSVGPDHGPAGSLEVLGFPR